MKLYKYLSEEVALKFIKNPLLRLTPSWGLNDPFECNLSSYTRSQLNKIDNYSNRDEAVDHFMHSHGVISLTETYDNLLMWSHYGDNHKGAVIEFLVDDKNPFKLFNTTNIPRSSDYIFNKVNYRKWRGFKGYIEANHQSLSSIREHYYLTKSDEWIYEKEHRFLLPSCSATNVISKNPSSQLAREIANEKGIFSLFDQEKRLKLYQESRHNDLLFFLQVNANFIGRIFLGCNADLERYKTTMEESELIGNYCNRTYSSSITNKFNGVELAKIDPERFELTFSPLEDPVNQE